MMARYSLLVLAVCVLGVFSQNVSNGNITMLFTPQNGAGTPLTFQCNAGTWTNFFLGINIQVFVNGSGPNPPMAETGLPTIQMSWFINGVAANPFTYTQPSNVANPKTVGNTAFFDLMDDNPNVGGAFSMGTCTNGQAQPNITVFLKTDTFIIGQGVGTTIPAVNAVPTLVNGFNAANVYIPPTPAPTAAASNKAGAFGGTASTGAKAGVAIGVVIGIFGVIAGVVYYKKWRSGNGFKFSSVSKKSLLSPQGGSKDKDAYISMMKDANSDSK
jgi:hypothetical protein